MFQEGYNLNLTQLRMEYKTLFAAMTANENNCDSNGNKRETSIVNHFATSNELKTEKQKAIRRFNIVNSIRFTEGLATTFIIITFYGFFGIAFIS